MANVYDANIYAKFYNEKQRDDWIMEHGVNQSIPKGGPVTSYSTDYEAHYRDLVTELADALEGILRIVAAVSLSQGLGQNQLKRVEQAKSALQKAGR